MPASDLLKLQVDMIGYINKERPFIGNSTVDGTVLPIRSINTKTQGIIEIYDIDMSKMKQYSPIIGTASLIWPIKQSAKQSIIFFYKESGLIHYSFSGYEKNQEEALIKFILDADEHKRMGIHS